MFDIYKKLDLSEYGEEWKDCYLKFRSISVGEAQEFVKLQSAKDEESVDLIISILQKYYLEGYAVSDGKRVEVKKEDLDKMPFEVLIKAIQLFNPQLDEEKKRANSV